ncbi:MAG: FecR domain-containing protein [Betaproteobacteria bacterium]|nr:FecR domain-containing protein [Betaproteobacteria bacterium]
MPQDRFSLNGRAALLALIASAYPVIGYSATAAQVDFAVGNVTAVGSNGQSRPLGKGAQIEQGDTVNTNGGRAQLRFTDGAYVSLQPESQFRIDQYRFDGKQDGNEKGFFSLLKGGLRTITGLVGRSNKQNYQVSTSVATIGIRGTEYTIQYGKSVTGTVGEGQIEVCNGAGCLSVTNGESYYVQTQEVKPVLTNKRTDLPPPEPTTPPVHFTQGENTDASGNPVPGFILTGALKLDFVSGNLCDGLCASSGSTAPMVFDSQGTLTGFNSQNVTSVQMGGNDGIVAWGTFRSLTPSTFGGNVFHFVIGSPVPSSDLANLGGTTATYSLIGATPVTNGSDQVVGSLNSATLSITFGVSNPVSAAMTWTINGSPLSATLSGSNSGSTFFLSGSCGGSCFVQADGALFGPNAVRAGMVYGINANLVGAAAFAR